MHDLYYECQDRCNQNGISTTGRIKIAVLDTGFHLPEALGENYREEGRINLRESESFVSATEEGYRCGWEVDRDGHGTRVGQIILQVAPVADLHVARVMRTRHDLADPNIAPKTHARIAKVSTPNSI